MGMNLSAGGKTVVLIDEQLVAVGAELAQTSKTFSGLMESYMRAIHDGELSEQEQRNLQLSVLAMRRSLDAFNARLSS